MKQVKLQSVLGPIYVVASEHGICGVHIGKKQTASMIADLDGTTREVKWLKKAVIELTEYFEGKRKKFSVPLDFHGTPFQERVWGELLRIPYGATLSYAEVASRMRHKKAARAVGNANGKNPLCILVPCHRVIASGGRLGGYSGGVEIKKKLLEIEKMG